MKLSELIRHLQAIYEKYGDKLVDYEDSEYGSLTVEIIQIFQESVNLSHPAKAWKMVGPVIDHILEKQQ